MSEDFYPFVDSGDPAPDNTHLTGAAPIQEANRSGASAGATERSQSAYTTRISVYDDMLSTPRVIVVEQADVRTYLEDVTNTVHRTMKEQGGHLSLMIIRELVENFIHAQFSEPVISILDNGDTIRFADQGPGIDDKERAFEFGVTSADRFKKRYIRGTGAGLPMVQQYVEAAGGAISVEDNLGAGTVVTVSVNPVRVEEIERAVSRGAAVRSGHHDEVPVQAGAQPSGFGAVGAQASPNPNWGTGMQAETDPRAMSMGAMAPPYPQGYPWMPGAGVGYPAYGNPYGMAQPYGGIPQGYPMQMGQLGQQSHRAMLGGQMMGMPNLGGVAGGTETARASMTPGTATPGATMPAAMPTPGMATNAIPGEPQPSLAPRPYVSERGALALRYIAQNGKGGPTDLTRTYGNSDATWSRELDTLSGTGLIYKRGQKYVLTELGQGWAQQQ